VKNKTVMITGGNSGVGKSLALKIAKEGAFVSIICRSEEKGLSAKSDIIKISGNPDVNLIIADLSTKSGILKAAEEFKSKFNSLDLLINNAATTFRFRTETADGFEATLAVNQLAYFLLTNSLLDLLIKSAPSRIVNICSKLQKPVDFGDIMFKNNYNPYHAYARTKAMNVMFTYELADRLTGTGVTALCFHPGVVRTNVYRNLVGIQKFLVKKIFWTFFITPDESADNILHILLSKDYKNATGKYFFSRKEKQSIPQTYDKELTGKLWNICSELTEIKTSI
jgi:NAD(P)-dependent dehydrogenase (short-subunit alcohol dehydrogenase family)